MDLEEQVSEEIKYDRRLTARQFKNRRAYGYTASPVAITSSEPVVF
jgi:hypothetical protein